MRTEYPDVPEYAYYNRKRANYVEPTPEQLERAHQIAQKLITEKEKEGYTCAKSAAAPNPGWNFGSGSSGVIE